jgi:hypothetical protein
MDIRRDLITDNKAFFHLMAITETNYHYNGDGLPTNKDNSPKSVRGRIVEMLLLQEYATRQDNSGKKHFYVETCLEVSTRYSSGQYEATSKYIFVGEPDAPTTAEARKLRENFPLAWDEFSKHRGHLFHAGQWIKSAYTLWLEEQNKIEQEALNSLKKSEEVKKNALPTKK